METTTEKRTNRKYPTHLVVTFIAALTILMTAIICDENRTEVMETILSAAFEHTVTEEMTRHHQVMTDRRRCVRRSVHRRIE